MADTVPFPSRSNENLAQDALVWLRRSKSNQDAIGMGDNDLVRLRDLVIPASGPLSPRCGVLKVRGDRVPRGPPQRQHGLAVSVLIGPELYVHRHLLVRPNLAEFGCVGRAKRGARLL